MLKTSTWIFFLNQFQAIDKRNYRLNLAISTNLDFRRIVYFDKSSFPANRLVDESFFRRIVIFGKSSITTNSYFWRIDYFDNSRFSTI